MPNDRYYMGFATHAATASKDHETQVGAAIVGPDGEVRLTGYNGPPAGVKDSPDRLCRPTKYPWMSHAEQNVVAFAAREGIRLNGCTLYVTHAPCSNCTRSIIQAGITCVVVGGGETTAPPEDRAVAEVMFDEAEVEVRRLYKGQGRRLHEFSEAVKTTNARVLWQGRGVASDLSKMTVSEIEAHLETYGGRDA